MPAAGGAREVAPQQTRYYRRGRLVVAGVTASKSGDESRGILRPLARVKGNLTFTLALDVSSEEGVLESTLENMIKDTIRQIGARLVEEEKTCGTANIFVDLTVRHSRRQETPTIHNPAVLSGIG